MEKGKTTDLSFYSNELQEQVQILVYTPPQFTPLNKYAYCIAQDGKDYFQLGRIARTIDELLYNGEIEPILFFGIPYQNVADRRKKYHPLGSMQKQYMRFLVYELIPFIEERFPVLHMGQSRALAGDSLAATISLLTALEYPHTFGKIMLHSPYVDENVINAVNHFSNGDLLTAYHVIGKEETFVKMTNGETADFLTPNRTLSKSLTNNIADYFYDEFDGNHTWKYWQKDIKRALTFLFPNE
ncbi:alpha/beta hydrolase-fold protein [Caldibacillus lycopersici]|uniref:Alpha/beta hydrolase-fold protein n=1 Tax=Perspicuibacillus lycopersici TaxID=1325689 RepID=A0AAE3IS50_9BACI|nr:alpha/beta hydrolase-fold protein [Perspicuibacillus lycopersici]MCU9612411.1 alpha/beta hydrolase-fold protein [Perspicuibacillus lycopersici]